MISSSYHLWEDKIKVMNGGGSVVKTTCGLNKLVLEQYQRMLCYSCYELYVSRTEGQIRCSLHIPVKPQKLNISNNYMWNMAMVAPGHRKQMTHGLRKRSRLDVVILKVPY